MNNYLVMTILGGVSGGILYFVGKEVYDRKYQQNHKLDNQDKEEQNQELNSLALDHKECKYKKIINPGLIVGAGIGFTKAYYDRNL